MFVREAKKNVIQPILVSCIPRVATGDVDSSDLFAQLIWSSKGDKGRVEEEKAGGVGNHSRPKLLLQRHDRMLTYLTSVRESSLLTLRGLFVLVINV